MPIGLVVFLVTPEEHGLRQARESVAGWSASVEEWRYSESVTGWFA